VTNTSWKCTAKYYTDWMQPTYNDASWPAAVFVQPNSPSNAYHNRRPEISANAAWIWTRNFLSPIDPVVYCRGCLPRMFYTYTVVTPIFYSAIRNLSAVAVLCWGQGAQPSIQSCSGPSFFWIIGHISSASG